MIGACGKLDLNPEVRPMIQEFFNGKEPTGPSTLMKRWDMALQCRAQSSHVKALHSAGLTAI